MLKMLSHSLFSDFYILKKERKYTLTSIESYDIICRSKKGYSQAVRHKTLTLAFAGSSPAIPARKKHTFVYQDNVCFFQLNPPSAE